MKLRLRSFESKETLKIEVSNSYTLSELKQTLVQALPNSPALYSIRLSLNRKDDLVSDGGVPLHSLGIAAGDLIYFSLDQRAAGMSSNSQVTLPLSTGSRRWNTQNILPGAQNSDFAISGLDSSYTKENVESGSQSEEHMEVMEVDVEDNRENNYETDGFSADEVADKSFSVPGYLRKVFMEELGDDDARKDHKLIAVAIHAVMLETGFVGFDNNANTVVNRFHFRDNEWPSSLFLVSLHYTLQENPNPSPAKPAKSIVMKFQSLGKFINVYGSLENGVGKRGMYRVQLNGEKLVPFLNVVWANINREDVGLMNPSPDKEVFEFWRTVKDNLALPLLFDLCDELGLKLPPCFMQLPTDLKLKILETLSGVEIAKMSCVCSEMRYLGSNDDLWKLRYVEEFAGREKVARGSWKKTFATYWAGRKNRKVSRARMLPYWAQPRRRYRSPFMIARPPRIRGGDYDISPSFEEGHIGEEFVGINRWSWSSSPQCHLGICRGRFV